MGFRTVRQYAFTLLAGLAMIVSTVTGVVPAVAQNGTSDIAVHPTEHGEAVYDACFILVDYSLEGCDANRDGQVTFDDIPWGTYTLRQTRDLGPGRQIPDQTIQITGSAVLDGRERFYPYVTPSSGGSTSDIAIVTSWSNAPFTDACYVLVDFGNEGCDENRNGEITFEDIPYGTYTLRQTRDLGSGRSVPDQTIRVAGNADNDGWERFYVDVSEGSSSGPNGLTFPMHIRSTTCASATSCEHEIGATFTVTALDGDYIGACSLEGERDFPLVVSCTVLIPQYVAVKITQDPTSISPGYVTAMNPQFWMYEDGMNVSSHPGVGFANFPAADSQRQGVTSDIQVGTGEANWSAYDACYVLVGFSNEGCDENRDGAVTFDDVPVGSYTLRQTRDLGSGRLVPDTTIIVSGNVSAGSRESFSTNIVVADGQTIAVSDVAVVTTQNGSPVYDACFVLVDFSNEGCDENGDGKITFEDIPVGTYTLRQTRNLGAGRSVPDQTIRVTGNADADG